MNEKTIVKKEAEPEAVETFILRAIKSKLPVETMEKLFALQEKSRTEKAKSAFVAALTAFQKKCPIIKKTKKVLNKDGQTLRYQYAPLDSIVEQIRDPLSENNLSYTWETKNEEGFITAVATITHTLGHSEKSEFRVPIDPSAYMTAPQQYASALTFAKRYSLCNALGISTGDEDTDATDTNKEKDVKSPKSKIVFSLRSLNKKTATKDDISNAVKELADLELEEKNYPEIIKRLSVLVAEQQKYENSKV